MNENEAQSRGYRFCGPVLSQFVRDVDIKIWKEKLEIAKKIKKEYKDTDYVIVTGTKNSWLSQNAKGLYGNEVFAKVWDLLSYGRLENQQHIIENLQKIAEENYRKALNEIEERKRQYQENVAFLESLKR